jgi:ketosteroid isomerase-like protein
MQSTRWWDSLFASIDAKQTAEFAAMLCEDAVFRYGSGPEVHGRAAIGACVEQVFAPARTECYGAGKSRICGSAKAS